MQNTQSRNDNCRVKLYMRFLHSILYFHIKGASAGNDSVRTFRRRTSNNFVRKAGCGFD